MQGEEKGGDSPPLLPLGVRGGPKGCAFQGSWEACAQAGGRPAGPAASAPGWSPASNPSPRVEGGGGGGGGRGGGLQKKKKKSPPCRPDPSDGRGRKPLSAGSAGRQGCTRPPRSAAAKAAPPPPIPARPHPPPLPTPHALWPARGGAGLPAGAGRAGEAAAAAAQAGPLSPARQRERAWKAAYPPAGVGAGAGAGSGVGGLPRNPRQI